MYNEDLTPDLTPDHKFGIRMVSLNQARGSGLIKKLREMDIESEKRDAIPGEKVMKELEEEENKRMGAFIEQRKDRKRVFYYQGFYGSLVPDAESNRLIGKIERIKENIIYEGKTIKECEQKFREAVLKYRKAKDI